MKKLNQIYLFLFVLISIFIFLAQLSLAQELSQTQPAAQEIPTEPMPVENETAVQAQAETATPEVAVTTVETSKPEAVTIKETEPETQWLWGEVISADATSGQLLVKYIDYETDNEKEITLVTSAETTYENVAALAEIKPKDTASIDYLVTSDGKNLAKHISVERIETPPVESVTPPESVIPSESETPKE